MSNPRTLGELKRAGQQAPGSERQGGDADGTSSRKLRAGRPLFPGVLGYEETVVPQVVNAILSRHNMILLGLRGQAKSRLLRSLTTLLDPVVPVVAGSEIHDDPFRPLSQWSRDLLARAGRRHAHRLAHPAGALRREAGHAGRDHRRHHRRRGPHPGRPRRPRPGQRAHHALRPAAPRPPRHLRLERAARPRGTDPGRASSTSSRRATSRSRAIRYACPSTCALVFTANPEDYTARGKIITPLKDRIGSEIRTHYPASLEQGVAITTAGGLDRPRRPACASPASSARSWRAWPSPPVATRRSTSAAG